MKDLHTFLEELEATQPEKVMRIKEPINMKYEITTLQHALYKEGVHPVIICEKPIKIDGTISEIPMICNLTASREICCQALELSDPRQAAVEYGKKMAKTGRTYIVPKEEAKCKEIIDTGDKIDLFKFPHTIQHEMNPGAYINAGSVTMYDPDTGIDNTSLMRLWVREKNWTGLVPAATTHNLTIMNKFFARGEDCPVAVWMGHHPAGLIGAQSKLGFPVSHYPSMAGALGEDLRLVATETFGEKLLVPADAEIVIEGVLECNKYLAEGPYAEYTGYVGPQVVAPVFTVTAVTYRKDAIYQDYALALPDMLVPDNMAIEARIYGIVSQVVPELRNVHVPISGKRFHAYLQIDKTRPAIGKDAILAAKPCYARLKHIFVFDKDVDIFDDSQVMWAIATRSQWDRDVYILPGGTGSPLDPTQAVAGISCNGGIDCTMPAPMGPGLPNFFAPRNKIPEEETAKMRLEDWVSREAISKMPKTF